MYNSPVEVLRHYYKMNEEAFKRIYWFVENKKEIGWSDWCFVPLSAVYAALCPVGEIEIGKGVLIGIIGALAIWRVSQGIYKFDKEILEELWETEISEEIDEGVLFHLPEYCVYIEIPEKMVMGEKCFGVWVHLEEDANSKKVELRLVFNFEDKLLPLAIHLGEGGLVQGIKQSVATSMLYSPQNNQMPVSAIEELFKEVSPIISLILYLCTVNADISEGGPVKYKLQKTKKGYRCFAPAKSKEWGVAIRLGAELKRAKERYYAVEYQGGTKRPHIRRAHYHTYWIEKKAVLKWLPPIAVKIDTFTEENITVIKKIK